jgi:general secretion pathway protein E
LLVTNPCLRKTLWYNPFQFSSFPMIINILPFPNSDELPKMPFLVAGVSSRFIKEHRLIPLEVNDQILSVLTDNAQNLSALDALQVASAMDIIVYTCDDENLINDYLAKFYTRETQNISSIIEGIDEKGFDAFRQEDDDVGHLKDLASEAPIIKLVNLIMTRAIEGRASDIHIEPYEDEVKVRYRVDGVLHDMESIPKKLQAAVVSRVKIMARLNIAERRLPQDGRIQMKVDKTEIDLRVSTIPVVYGESLVMRILNRESIVVDLDLLGFQPSVLSTLNNLIHKPNGIVLVTGPTGSGKTTTLYGALACINSPDKKIITVEDPVEYLLKGINQIQVKPQIGLHFNNTLRHIVRQDPDVIMIGEIRDLETAEIAIQSALTGHLVFSTLHTNDAPSAITRLIDMGVESFLLASTMRGILAQRLVRVICPRCKKVDDGAKLAFIDDFDGPSYIGAGCEYCSYTGYFGRTGIFEMLAIDEEMRRLILDRVDSHRITTLARSRGMRTLLEDGLDKIKSGITTLGEVYKVTQEA